jgi:hypothetical protein
MASTVNQIIARFQRRFRGVEASYALTLFDDAHRTILKKCEVRNTTRAITLTSGTRQYDLAASVYKVHEAYYERTSDAGTWTPIIETSLSKLAAVSQGWRARSAQSEPYFYYITSATSTDSGKNQIGFEPIPGTTSSGGYPRVVLYVTEYAALTGSETVPENLLDDSVYLDLMSESFCKENEHEKLALYTEAARRSLEANAQHVENLQSRGSDFEIITPFRSGLGRVF